MIASKSFLGLASIALFALSVGGCYARVAEPPSSDPASADSPSTSDSSTPEEARAPGTGEPRGAAATEVAPAAADEAPGACLAIFTPDFKYEGACGLEGLTCEIATPMGRGEVTCCNGGWRKTEFAHVTDPSRQPPHRHNQIHADVCTAKTACEPIFAPDFSYEGACGVQGLTCEVSALGGSQRGEAVCCNGAWRTTILERADGSAEPPHRHGEVLPLSCE